jgi:hypothetical protein
MSHSTGTIRGTRDVGGFVGDNRGIIIISYNSRTVNGEQCVGGFVGLNRGSIAMSYSTGTVTGNEIVGGLVGENEGSIASSYSTGAVTGNTHVGGLLGSARSGDVVSVFWDIETSGQPTSDGGIGLDTTEMQTESTFTNAGWDFVDETENGDENVWWIDERNDYPRLWWELRSL